MAVLLTILFTVVHGAPAWKQKPAVPQRPAPVAYSALYVPALVGGAPGSLEWEFPIYDNCTAVSKSNPAVAGSTVFVRSPNRLYALDSASRILKWRFDFYVGPNYDCNVYPDMSPVVSPDNTTVFVASSRGLFAVGVATGAEKWNISISGRNPSGNSIYTSASPEASVIGGEPTVFFGRRDGTLIAADVGNGTIRWSRKVVYNQDIMVLSNTVSADGRIVYVVTQSPGYRPTVRTIFAVNATTGYTKWNSSPSIDAGLGMSTPAESPDGKTVYFGAQSSTNGPSLCAVNAADGTLKWRFLTVGAINSSPVVSADGKTVFARSEDGHLYAVDADTSGQKWSFNTGAGVGGSVLSLDGETVYAGSNGTFNTLYALDAAGGTKQWSSLVDGGTVSSPVMSTDGNAVFVVSADGVLHAVDAQAPPPAPAGGGFVCMEDHCRPSNMTSVGIPKVWCESICGTAALKYKCVNKRCIPDDGGIPYESCEGACL